MTLKKLARVQLAVFEALRRLGFKADDIFVAFYNGGELFTELHQGEQRFRITISRGTVIDSKAYKTLWEVEAERWNKSMTDAERMKIYRKEFSVEKLLDLTDTLKHHGFVVPKLQQ